MSLQETIAFLEVSRATLYNMIADGRLTPLPGNPALKRQPRRFDRAQVYALRPDKAPPR